MERIPKQTARGQRLLFLGAIVMLAVPASLAFGRMFAGAAPAWQLAGAAAAAAVLASLTERRGVFLAAAVSAGALFAVLGFLLFPETTWHGSPTLSTLQAMRTALLLIGAEARTRVAPSAPVAPLMMATIAGVWTATFAAHALAVRAKSPLLAAVPLLALFGFADIVLKKGPNPLLAAWVLLGVLAVLFADGMSRVRQWGPLQPWPRRAGAGGKARIGSAPAVKAARRAGAVAVVAALILPAAIPGYHSQGHLDINAPAAAGQVDPFVSIRASLRQTPPVELFDVIADRPAYWRIMSLDHFDGTTWSTQDLQASTGQQVFAGPTQPLHSTGTAFPVNAPVLHQSVHILNLQTQWLPMAASPQALRLDQGEVRYNPELDFAAAPDGLSPGYSYEVDSRLIQPTPAELDGAADPGTAAAGMSPEVFQTYTSLPASTPAAISNLVHRITDGEPNAYRKLIALQDFLRSNFQYDEHAVTPPNQNPLLYFLTASRRGFCQQFASAMAVFARELGYPSRVAVGFQTGFQDTSGTTFAVTTSQAHAWPEILFPGYGWIAFEPTPGRANPVANGYVDPPAYQSPDCPACSGTSRGSARGSRIESIPHRPPGAGRHLNTTDPIGAFHDRAGPSIWPKIGFGLLLIGLFLAIAIPPAKMLARRLRLGRRHSGDPAERILAVFRNLEAGAADLGAGRRAAETPAEYADRLRSLVESSEGPANRLALLATKAAYSSGSPSQEEAEEAAADAGDVLRDLRKATPAAKRMAGAYRMERASSRSGSPGLRR